MVAGIGATFAWVFAVWAGVIRRVEDQVAEKEAQAQQVRIQDMQQDLDRYKATLDAQLGLLPASVERSESISSDN
ncbi:MAG: hypothetical protein ERJ68_01975 [Aphanocapsa feldmannii 277cI]|nr:MAG: hypothetical protein ERJ68_01975 [Aphanocapsa feldmannii 277cI]